MVMILPMLSFLYLWLETIHDYLKIHQTGYEWSVLSETLSSYLMIAFPNSLVFSLAGIWGDRQLAELLMFPGVLIVSCAIGLALDKAISRHGTISLVAAYVVISFATYFLSLYFLFHS